MKRKTPKHYAVILYGLTHGMTGVTIERSMNVFISFLRRQNALSKLQKIADAFANYADERAGVKKVHITAAREMAPRELEDIGRIFAKKCAVSFSHDPLLIGGVVVREGDTVYDASVRMQVNRMRQRLESPDVDEEKATIASENNFPVS